MRGEKPERWVRQTDFGNAEAVGYLADRLNRIGIEDRLLQLGARAGDGVAIGGADAVVFDFAPQVDSGAEILSRRGEDQRFDRAATRRRAGGTSAIRPTTPLIQATAMREQIASAHRVVVKVGSLLADHDRGRHRPGGSRPWSHALAAARLAGREVVLVSSGAIAAGLAPLGLKARPRDLATQQAAASVGQGLLMGYYTQLFGEQALGVGQVLLTVDDVTRHGHYRNAYRTFGRLLELGVVPIVNENDTVATHEIRFGDNDRLAALVAHLVHADALVLLSDVDALYTANPPTPGARRITDVAADADLAEVDVATRGSADRHRRHGDQDRGGPDRHLGRHPGGADQRRAQVGAALARRAGRHPVPPDRHAAGRPGCCGCGTPATPAARSSSTPAPSGR